MQNQHLPYSKKEIARGGWPEPIAEIYAEQGGTSPGPSSVFGQLLDAESFAVLDAIAAVETGAMDKPVEDVVLKRLKLRTRMKLVISQLGVLQEFSPIPLLS